MATVSRAELQRLIAKLPDSELENARQALQALIDKAADMPPTLVYVPYNGRGGPIELPAVSRSEGAIVVVYDATKPRPSPEEIWDRLQSQESAGATAEQEWQESETDNRGRSQQG